jgi:predicted MPP superfamily phosphohydrolase
VVTVTRRDLLKGAVALGAGLVAGTVTHGYLWERHELGLTPVELPVSGLASALDGLRIGFLTDLHLSRLVPTADVMAAVDRVNAERPDLIVLGGDYVSFGDRAYLGPVAELLGMLRAPHGVFAILGNHDDERRTPDVLRQHGIEVLLDDRTAIAMRGAHLELAGIKFWTREVDRVRAAVAGAVGPVLLLAHDPRRVFEAAELGVAAVLAGHTHGGQIVLPGLGAIAARKFPVADGRLTHRTTEMFVSRGVGTVVVPLRINCPPEVAVVTLRSRPSAASR